MAPAAPHLERFLTAVRRRVIFVRAAERIGLCAAIACAAALALLPILLWRREPAMPLALGAIALGALGGLVWSLLDRPTLLGAAMEADRQLDLADLLGTALAVRTDPSAKFTSSEWSQLLLGLAESRCRTLSPSMLVLNRMGARAWGGIGLVAALVLTLAFMSSQPDDLRAAGASVEIVSRPANSVASAAPSPQMTSRNRPAAARDVTDDSNRVGDMPDPSPSKTGEQTQDHRAATGASAGAQNATGGGDSKTLVSQPRSDGQLPMTEAGSDASSGVTASGSGEAAKNDSKAGAAARSTGAVKAEAQHAVPPWQADTWNSSRAAAAETLRAGGVPDDDQDIVREYFRR